ncbi:MAG: hypothetical protein DDT37_01571 [Firmicutes bacterium]|nr:hypothetical protein [candidate division NPL-UPA2 bacterium]
MVYPPLKLSAALSRQGSAAHNEDAYVCEPAWGFYAVIDGATSVVPYRVPEGMTGGWLAAQVVALVLRQNARQRALCSLPLNAVLALANDALGQAMQDADIDTTQPENLWSACAAVVRLSDTYLEIAQIGDAVVEILYADGRAVLATPDQLATVSETTRQKCIEARAAGCNSPSELMDFLRPHLVANRRLANRPGGYGVLNGMPAAADFIFSQRIPLADITGVLLMTDGLRTKGTVPFVRDEADGLGVEAVVKHVHSMGLAGYISWLLSLEQEDSTCLRYPRVKVSDDKTAIWLSRLNPHDEN